MNIVMISFTGWAAEIYYLISLANAITKGISASKIIVLLPSNSKVETFGRDVSLIKFSFPRNLPKALLKSLDPFFYRHLLKEIDSACPDVVHIVFELRVPWFFVSALHHKYPIVTTVHEPRRLTRTLLRSALLNPIQDIDCWLIMKLSDKIIVHGQKHKEYLLTSGFLNHKIDVIPHGAFSFFNQWAREGIDTKKGSVLFFGKITPYKGIEYLIQAGKLIEQHFPWLTITIAGEGDFAKYEKLIKGDNHFIVDNGFIPEEEVAELFQRASVIVLPYVHGSQSGIITIAGAFKKPVVVTEVGHFPMMVEDGITGFIVPPRDAEALAESILKLLKDNKLREQMGENAYKKMKEELSWGKIAAKTIVVYKEVINEYKNKRRKIGDQKVS